MRLLLVGTPDERQRLRAELDDSSFTVAGEFATLADARASGLEAEGILISSPVGRALIAVKFAGYRTFCGTGPVYAGRGVASLYRGSGRYSTPPACARTG